MASKKPWDKRRIQLQELLRQIRMEAELTQTQLATRLDSDQSFVSRYERGERRLDLVELEMICKACRITLPVLISRFEK